MKTRHAFIYLLGAIALATLSARAVPPRPFITYNSWYDLR